MVFMLFMYRSRTLSRKGLNHSLLRLPVKPCVMKTSHVSLFPLPDVIKFKQFAFAGSSEIQFKVVL